MMAALFPPIEGLEMFRRLGVLFFTAMLALVPFATTVQAAGAPDKAAVEQIIHDYLFQHPEVLVQALQSAEEKAAKEAEEHGRVELTKRYAELAADPRDPVLGNPKGDVTIIEFFDYRCPYCKQVAPALQTLLSEDKNLRVVFKEFPILGADSKYAARAALASAKQGKYQAFHTALMKNKGQLTDETVINLAQSVGIDTARLKADIMSNDIDGVLMHNSELAQALNIRGTPAFIVGKEILAGAADLDTLRKTIAAARKQG